jgi:hypothetical protein
MKVQDDKVTQDKWKDAKDCKELTAQWKSQAYYDVEDKDTLAADGDLREWCCLCAQEHPPGGKVLGSSKCSMCSRYIRAHAYKHVNSYSILPGYLESSLITVGTEMFVSELTFLFLFCVCAVASMQPEAAIKCVPSVSEEDPHRLVNMYVCVRIHEYYSYTHVYAYMYTYTHTYFHRIDWTEFLRRLLFCWLAIQ